MGKEYDWDEIDDFLGDRFLGNEAGHPAVYPWNPSSNLDHAYYLVNRCTDEKHDTSWDVFDLHYDYDQDEWRAMFSRSLEEDDGTQIAYFCASGNHKSAPRAICLAVLDAENEGLSKFLISYTPSGSK